MRILTDNLTVKRYLANLKVRSKMTLAAVLLLMPLSYLALQFYFKAAEDIQGTQSELSGIAYITPLQNALQGLQRRRGHTAAHSALLDNAASVKSDGDSVRKAMDAFDQLQATFRNPFNIETEWSDLKTKIGYLLDTPLTADRRKHLELHTDTIRSLLLLQGLISERSMLDLEPEAGPYYLMELSLKLVAPITEVLGRMRYVGGQLLSNGAREPQLLNELEVLSGVVAYRLEDFAQNKLRNLQYNPDKVIAFQKSYAALEDTAEAFRAELKKTTTGAGASTAKYFAAATAYVDAFFTLAAEANAQLQAKLAARRSLLRAKQLSTFFLTLVGVILSGFVGWLILRQISQSLQNAIVVAENLAAGNLEFDINADTHDEIGAFMNSLQIMAERLRGVLRQVHQSAHEISLASQQVASTAEMLNNGAMDQAAHVEETGSALGEMVALIKSNADTAVETDNTATVAVKNTQIGAENVLQAVESMKEISERIQIVQEIASQTNLLALNATIEAARAGEHGRGFAVVATEVGKLADTSGQAAKQIQALLKESSAISTSAASSLNIITTSMQDTAHKVVNIRKASEEQNEAAQQISESMGRLNQTTEQTASAAEELAATAEQMSSQTATLLENLRFFRFGSDGDHGVGTARASSSPAATIPVTATTGARRVQGQSAAHLAKGKAVVSSGDYEKF